MTDQAAGQKNRRSRFRNVGTVAIFLLAALVVGGIVLLHVRFEAIANANPMVDHSVRFLGTVMGVLLVLTLIGSWIVFLSPLSFRIRAGLAVIWIVGLIVLFLAVEPVNDGNVVPRGFRFRWQPTPDETLALPKVEEVKGVDFSNVDANLATMPSESVEPAGDSQFVFNQFLGNQRRGSVENVKLATDWETTPPVELWKQPIGAAWSGFAAANGYAVTMEQRGEEELTTCYSIDTGDVVWFHAETARHQTPLGGIGPRSTPTIHQGKVYSIGANGILLCLQGADGDVVWRVNLFEMLETSPEEQQGLVTWGRAGSPLIFNDWVIVPGGGSSKANKASLIAFDKDNGREIWRTGADQISYASPFVVNIDGRDQIVTLNENVIVGYDPLTREELWRSERPGASNAGANTSQPIYFGDGRFLVTKGYGLGAETFQVEKTGDGEYQARVLHTNRRLLKTKFSNCVVKGGFAYGLSDGILECVELESLQAQWKQGRYGHGQILLVGDAILVLTEEGEVVLVEASPKELHEYGRFKALEGVTWNTLCLVGDRLLIRNAEMAACWQLPMVTNDLNSGHAKRLLDSEVKPTIASIKNDQQPTFSERPTQR